MKNTASHSVYVKLPIYVGQFLKYVFRAKDEQPITLPESTELQTCLFSNLTENRNMVHCATKSSNGHQRYITSYSEKSYELGAMKNRPVSTYRMKAPKKRELENLFPFTLPEYVWKKNGKVDINEYYELTVRGGREFREMCINIFWVSLRSYIVGQNAESARKGISFNKINAIEKFLAFHSVDVIHRENVLRTYSNRYRDTNKFVK